MTDQVMFDVPTYRRLKLAYREAVQQEQDVFKFEGREYVTDFAKYLLEHLENELGGRR